MDNQLRAIVRGPVEDSHVRSISWSYLLRELSSVINGSGGGSDGPRAGEERGLVR